MTSDRGAATATAPAPRLEHFGPPRGDAVGWAGPLPGVRLEPHGCFACGELNVHGVHLRLHADETGAWTDAVLEPRFQGWEEVVHGGIVCTLLDEVMAWSVIGRGTWGVTARMSVDFKRPLAVGRAALADGRVVEERRRVYRTQGRIRDVETGDLLASAEAVFVAVPPDRLAELRARYGLGPVAAPRSILVPASPEPQE